MSVEDYHIPWTMDEERSTDIVIRNAQRDPVALICKAGWDKKSPRKHAKLIIDAVEAVCTQPFCFVGTVDDIRLTCPLPPDCIKGPFKAVEVEPRNALLYPGYSHIVTNGADRNYRCKSLVEANWLARVLNIGNPLEHEET